PASFTNCTFTSNHSTAFYFNQNGDGGLITYSPAASPAAPPVLRNTVFVSNGLRGDIIGAVTSRGYNFISDGTNAVIQGDSTGNRVGTSAMLLDPMLGPLQDNGGPTPTRLPLPGSPLLDAGDPRFAPPPDTDPPGRS